MGYLGNPVTITGTQNSKRISTTATASQTAFTVTGGYQINQIDVYRNGVKLSGGRDFTATDGATVTLTQAANENDIIEFVIFENFDVADALSANGDQTINGSLTIIGSLTADIPYASSSGIATYATTAGIATYATTAGIATYATTAGIATYASSSGIATYASSSGIATYATTSGVSTSLLGGNAGVNTTSAPTNLYVSGNAAGSVVGLGTTDANTTLDFSTGNNFSLTLTGSIVLSNPTGVTTGQSGIVLISQDGSGSRTCGFGSHWDFPSATAPTLSTGADALDALTYFVRSSTSIVTNSLIGIGTL